MGDTNFRGPINAMGALEVQSGTAATISPQDGPSTFYQGVAMIDPRNVPYSKVSFRPGNNAAFFVDVSVPCIDAIPQARSSTQLAAAQVGTTATAVSLATTQVAGLASSAFIAVGVPIIPVGTSVVTYAIALDFGFTTGTTVAASTTVTVIDSAQTHTGQWLVIGGAGNAAATRSHIAQVQTIPSSTTITISPAAVTSISNAPIGQGNLFGSTLLPGATQFGPAASSASAHSFAGSMVAGASRVINPKECLTRNISVQGVTSLSSYSCVVSGWDLWGNAMTEVISMSAATAQVGKKAFKYIGSITSGTGTPSGTQTVAFGLGDTVGLPFRADTWDSLYAVWNSSAVTNSNGYTAATLATATSTTGDVRGSLQLSTAIVTGALTTAIGTIASNGTSRLTVIQSLTPWQMTYATPLNTVPMFGPTQSTATT